MKNKRTALVAFLMLAMAAITGVSCAQKKGAVVAYQSVQVSLGAFQDAEMALYATKSNPALTDAVHADISRALARVFEVQERLGDALLLWKADQPAPASVTDYLAEATRLIEAVEAKLPGDARVRLASDLVRWAKALVELSKQLKVVPPIPVMRVAEQGVR